MRNLLRSYNRTYYWKLIKIKEQLYRRLLRLYIAGNLLKFSMWLCPDLKREINNALRRST